MARTVSEMTRVHDRNPRVSPPRYRPNTGRLFYPLPEAFGKASDQTRNIQHPTSVPPPGFTPTSNKHAPGKYHPRN
eukprot:6024101-Prymnesium_polylepis.2